MSEKEKQIVEKLKDAIPNFDKGYILGKVENMAENSAKKEVSESKE